VGYFIRPKGHSNSQDTSYVNLPSGAMSKSYNDSLSPSISTNLTIQRLPLPTESYEPENLTLEFQRPKSRKSVIFAYSGNLV